MKFFLRIRFRPTKTRRKNLKDFSSSFFSSEQERIYMAFGTVVGVVGFFYMGMVVGCRFGKRKRKVLGERKCERVNGGKWEIERKLKVGQPRVFWEWLTGTRRVKSFVYISREGYCLLSLLFFFLFYLQMLSLLFYYCFSHCKGSTFYSASCFVGD